MDDSDDPPTPGQEPTSGVNYLKLLHQQQEQALRQKAKQLSFRQILGQEGK